MPNVSVEPRPKGRPGDGTMFARIGIMRGLNRQVERTFNLDRKDRRLELKAVAN